MIYGKKFKQGDQIQHCKGATTTAKVLSVKDDYYFLEFGDGSCGRHSSEHIDKFFAPAEKAGFKADTGKPKLSMLFQPVLFGAIVALVRVLEYGAKKYPSADNWTKVEDAVNRYRDAALRHVAARASGEIVDPESGLPHMAHAACSVLFSLALDLKEKS